MEAYIGKCLDSLLIPEFDAVEVLVVNDGSKDRSSEIAHSYADRYPGSIRVIDKPNGNYGSCINAALPLATGRYIKVLDADDTFDTAAFSSFVRLLPSINDDVVITSYTSVNEKGEPIKHHDFSKWNVKCDSTYYTKDALSRFLFRYIDMHRITYSRKIFEALDYHQTEGISYTDTEWSIIPMSECGCFRCLDLPVYLYLEGREGQMMTPANLSRNISSLFTVLCKVTEYYNNLKTNNPKRRILYNHIRNRHKTVYFIAIAANSPIAYKLLETYELYLKEHCPDIFEAVGNIYYTPAVKFRIFKDLRKKGYPLNYKVPIWVKAMVAISAKLKNVFHI